MCNIFHIFVDSTTRLSIVKISSIHPMIRNINDITIKGGCFTDGAELKGICSNSFNIVYGRNGSGKSTIARAFNTIANPVSSNVLEASVKTPLTDEEKKNIHVFNEDFIDKKIRIKDQLEAIFMAGQQVELDDQINDLTTAISDNTNKLTTETENRSDLDSKLTEINNSITRKLKENGGYADRGKIIEGRKNRIPVSGPQDVEAYRNQTVGLNQTDLRKQIDENISRLSVSTDDSPIIWNVPSLPSSNLFEHANKLLVMALPQPKMTKHDSIVARVATNAALNHYLHDAERHFKDEKLDFCPLCQQPIDPNYVDKLMDRIASVLDETSNNFIDEIDACKTKLEDVNIGELPKQLFEKECKDCELAVSKLNDYLAKIRISLDKKKSSLYTASAKLDKTTFVALTDNCKYAFDALNSKIQKRAQDIANRNILLNETKELNVKLACLECESEFKDRDGVIEQLGKIDNEIARLKKVIHDDKIKLGSLNAQSSNAEVAFDMINELLRIVFYGDDRLQLAEYDGNGYRLLSHGNPVSPDSVSTGERNVIALAYFFTQMLTNQSKESGYKTEMLVVIDDPVSSFDTNNRYGIISMITNQIRCILYGNYNSKVLFLTHDIQTLNDLVAMRTKLKRGKKKVDGEWVTLPACLNLCNNKLEEQPIVRSNNYADRLNSVFEYASKDTVERNDTIGNEIRSLMESYSTFMYQRGIDDVLGDKYILESVPEDVRPMFRDIPARLMLNNSSHGSLFTDTPITEYGVMTPEELHLLARRLLIFLYWTNKNHLYAYLRDDNNKMDIIKGWAREEERRAATVVV